MIVCTLALYFRMFEDYPLLVAANRDERYDRPAAPPTRWQTRPDIIAGRDLRAGGTWLGINEHGLLAGILNRRTRDEPAPRPGTRSRGLLCVDILAHKTADEARAFLDRHFEDYQPFTLVCADADQAWSAINRGRRIETATLAPGLSVFSNAGDNDSRAHKRDWAHQRFAAAAKELDGGSPGSSETFLRLRAVLSDHNVGEQSGDPRDAICMHGEIAGTVSSSIVLYSPRRRMIRTYYCPGAPCRGAFGHAADLPPA